MSAATSRCEAAPHAPQPGPGQEVRGRAHLRYARAPQGQILDLVYARDPLRLVFNRPEPGQPPTAVLVSSSGGLVGGDQLAVTLELGPGTQALVTSQAAEKVYRSTGPDSRVAVELRVEEGGRLEWLPQETIFFEGARLRRQTSLELRGQAQVLAGEILVFGRAARGEEITRGLLREAWQVRRDGRLLWADALHLEGDLARTLAHPAGLGGARACASAVFAAPEAASALDLVRECLGGPEGLRVGATALPGLVLARWLGPDAAALRRAYTDFWGELRARVWGLPRRLPRVWHL